MTLELEKISPNAGAYTQGTKFASTEAGGIHTPEIKVTSSALPTDAATATGQTALLNELKLKADLTETQPISASTLPLPTGAATSANQTDGSQKTKIIGTDGSGLDVYTRTQTPTNKVIGVQIGPGDIISNLPVVIDYAHHQVHEGETWQYTYGPAAIGQNGIVYLRVVVADVAATIRTPHALLELDTNCEIWLELYESPTTSANGTAATFHNRNRNIGGSPTTTIFTAPTVTAPGTKLSGWMVGSGQKAGGAGRDSTEWDLKANTVYLYKITAITAGNVCFRLIQYEDLGV